jgi:hypothetical protein
VACSILPGINIFSILYISSNGLLRRPSIPHLKQTNGYLIVISSTAAQVRVPGNSDYGVSKHAINRFVEFVDLGGFLFVYNRDCPEQSQKTLASSLLLFTRVAFGRGSLKMLVSTPIFEAREISTGLIFRPLPYSISQQEMLTGYQGGASRSSYVLWLS